MDEFIATSRLADVFSSSSSSYKVEVLTKQTVTVEVMQLKRSMYDDPEGFIFKYFDVFCNLLKNFEDYDESLKISAVKILILVSEKMVSPLSEFLKGDQFDQEDLFKRRNTLKMVVFLLCHFSYAFDKEAAKNAKAPTDGKKRKKASVEYSEWPEQRIKFVVVIKRLFKLEIHKLWDPPIVDSEFLSFVVITFFKLLENVDVAKDKSVRTEIFKFLGSLLKEYGSRIVSSEKIIKLVQDFEHLPSVLAEGVIYFVKECTADTLISDILKETTLIDVGILTRNLTAAHSLSHFLITIAEECPEKFIPLINLFLQFLECESHIMRNCALSLIGVLLSKTLCSENLSEKEKTVREELLEHLEDHKLDVNSFVRCRSIQVLKMLMEEKALASVELHRIGKAIANRLQDKASNVRKNAMSFMAKFVSVNQFACEVPLPVLKESYEKELEKLKQMKKCVPVIFEDSDDEEPKDKPEKGTALLFDNSDDDLEPDTEKESKDCEQASKMDTEDIDDDLGPDTEKESKDCERASEMDTEDVEKTSKLNVEKAVANTEETNEQKKREDLKVQEMLVEYIKNTLNFSEVINSITEPIKALLLSPTQTDVLEAIEFVISIEEISVTGSNSGIKEVLKLVWSKEVAVREAALNAFKTLYLSNGENPCRPSDIAENLIKLLNGATFDDAACINEFVKHFSQHGEISREVCCVLQSTILNPKSKLTEEENICAVQLLGMLAEKYPETILTRLENFVDVCLGESAEKSFLSAMYTFNTLAKINQKVRGKVSLDSSMKETRLPQNHVLIPCIKYYLINGIKNYEDDHWISMANEAVSVMFSFIEDPVVLCSKITSKLAETLFEEIKLEEGDAENIDDVVLQQIPSVLLCRFLAFCGHVALHFNSYMKVDYFAYLRREEALREKRRRRSSIRAASFHSSSFSSPLTKSTKKRRSFAKKYKLVPPVDEETTYEQVTGICANDAQNEQKLVGILLPFVIESCRWSLKVFNKEVQATASLSLAKFMLLSEQVCQDNMQLFATVTEKSPETYIRASMIAAMGDLTTAYPNIVEPWTQKIFQRLKDPESVVRENAIIILSNLILHDFVRIKSLVSDAAKCIADSNKTVSKVAKYLFAELSKKGNVIYNILPDIISSLSDASVDEETFQIVMKHILQYIQKEKFVEGLVEKLCYRFADTSNDAQIHGIAFCLSKLPLNGKCFAKLLEFKNFLKEKMSDPIMMNYMTNMVSNAKKNDVKTKTELETFRKELDV